MMLSPGERVQTSSGRWTSPTPRGPSSKSDRAYRNALVRLDAWLLREARKEVEGNDYLTTMLSQMDDRKLSRSDRSILNDILWP